MPASPQAYNMSILYYRFSPWSAILSTFLLVSGTQAPSLRQRSEKRDSLSLFTVARTRLIENTFDISLVLHLVFLVCLALAHRTSSLRIRMIASGTAVGYTICCRVRMEFWHGMYD